MDKEKEQRQKEEPERQPAGDGDAEFLARWAFSTAFGDHFETSLPALRDAAPVLRAAAKALGLPKAKRLRVYDPYFCEGAVVGLLRGLGFKRVYNRNEDFYAVAAARRLPAFDALLTNPPFSADHKVRVCGRSAGAGRGLTTCDHLPRSGSWRSCSPGRPSARPSPARGGRCRSRFCSRATAPRSGTGRISSKPSPGSARHRREPEQGPPAA